MGLSDNWEKRRDLAAERYCVKTDQTFEFAKSWAETAEIHQAGADWARVDLLENPPEELVKVEERDAYATAMKIALQDGVFPDKQATKQK